jgi:hypothetical protein
VRRISTQLKEVHLRNRVLTTSVGDVTSKNEGLRQRFDIALHWSTDAAQKFEEDLRTVFAQRETDHKSFQEEFHCEKEQSRATPDG